MIVGIDPGPKESAFAVINENYEIHLAGKIENADLISEIKKHFHTDYSAFAIESIQSYGQIVGKTVFETCYMVGRVQQVCDDRHIPNFLYPRPEYARAICGGMKVTDALLRSALMNRFGGDKKGEPLYILKGNPDKRSAFAVAVYHLDRKKVYENKIGKLLQFTAAPLR